MANTVQPCKVRHKNSAAASVNNFMEARPQKLTEITQKKPAIEINCGFCFGGLEDTRSQTA
jgi:hypothetical protein